MDRNQARYEYCLRLGDSSLIIGHRLSEWTGHGPVLEEDIAMTNIALDLVGQARTLLQYAAELKGNGTTEDTLAYHRDANEYRNLLICEQANGDFGDTMARHFLFDAYHYYFLKELLNSKDDRLAVYAEKCLKEVVYHLNHSKDWILRLGDGTEESHSRIQAAIDKIWPYTAEMFYMDEVDEMAIKEGFGVDLTQIESLWKAEISEVLSEATLTIPTSAKTEKGGKQGKHTNLLTDLLTEMQEVPRKYPDAVW